MTEANPGSAPFDAETFVRDLQRSTEEHALVVAQRPSGAALAETLGKAATLLYQWTDLLRVRACDANGVSSRQSYAWLPLEGSPAAEDRAEFTPAVERFCTENELSGTHWRETNPTRNPTEWTIDHLGRCFRTATDSLAGIAQLVEGSQRLRAPITLARSVLEAAATACFITDTSVDRRERLRRGLNLHLAQVKEASNDRRGSEDDRDPYEAEISELIAFAESVGFEVKGYKRSDLGPPKIRPPEGRHDSASSIIERVLPGVGLSMWRSMSAVAHSRASQLLIPDEVGLLHELHPWQRVESVALHTVPGILVVRELGDQLQRYLGWDFEPWPDFWTVVAAQWHEAAGMNDVRIRRDLGLPPLQST